MRYQTGTGALLVTDVGAAGGATPIGTFQATANGTGYSNGDLIIALSDNTWRNVTAGTTIGAPNTADLGTFGGSTDFEILLWRATAANGGLGYAVGDYLYEVFNTTSGGSSWYLNSGGIGAPPTAEREPASGSGSSGGTTQVTNFPATVATSSGLVDANTPRFTLASDDIDQLAPSPTATPYQINGAGPVLFGVLSRDRTTLTNIPSGVDITIGTGPTEAQLTASSSTGGLGSLESVTYDISDGAGGTTSTGNSGFAVIGRDDLVYPTANDAFSDENGITIGAANGNAIVTAVVGASSTNDPILLVSESVLEIPVTGDTGATADRPIAGGLITGATGFTVSPVTTFATITFEIAQDRLAQINTESETTAVATENEWLLIYTTDGTVPNPTIASELGQWASNGTTITISRSALEALRVFGNQDIAGAATAFSRSRMTIRQYQGAFPGPRIARNKPDLSWFLTGGTGANTAVQQSASVPVVLSANLNTDQQLVPANPSRVNVVIRNSTNQTVYVQYGSTAAQTTGGNYVYTIPASRFETDDFNGEIRVIAEAAATGEIVAREVVQ